MGATPVRKNDKQVLMLMMRLLAMAAESLPFFREGGITQFSPKGEPSAPVPSFAPRTHLSVAQVPRNTTDGELQPGLGAAGRLLLLFASASLALAFSSGGGCLSAHGLT
jgi:hypothetical protein